VLVSTGQVDSTIRIDGTVAAEHEITILAPRIQGSRADVNRGGSANMMVNRSGAGMAGGGNGAIQGFGAQQATDFSLILIKLAAPGSFVKAGDVIAQFDPQLQQQRLDDYKDSLVQSDANIRRQMANLEAAKETHWQEVVSAKAAWLQALQDQETNEVSSPIQAQLYDLAVEQDKAQWDQLAYEDDLVDQYQRALVKVQELNRNQADLELKRSEANVARMTIKAPIDGVVVMASIVRNGEFGQVREGDQVQAGQPFMYIEDPHSMVVNGLLNQVDAERLRMGMKARVRLDAYSDIDLPGTLVGIGAMSQTSTFRSGYVGEIPVRLKIDRMDPRIIPDLTVSAEVLLGSEDNTLVLPRSAVFEENGGKFVYLQSPEGWVRKPVETGLRSFTHVAIHSGLSKGDVVALTRPS
jgi:multidrug efflux pump subunit AcrA (membrane-fusion protein)